MRKPHFFKIIVPPLLANGKGLRIPPKFTSEYGKRLSNPTRLKVSTGRIWEMELHKDKRNNNLWLRKGWLEFAHFFSIQYGHFLVFRYEGNGSLFRVFIFDMTATEIEYLNADGSMLQKSNYNSLSDKLKQTNDLEQIIESEHESDDSSVQIVESGAIVPYDDSSMQIVENGAIVPYEVSQDDNVVHIEDDDEDESDDEDKEEEVTEPQGNGSPAINLKAVAEDLIRRDTSGFPSFIATVPPSAVNNNFMMTISPHHYREYLEGLPTTGEKMVLLSADDANGIRMTWPVKYTVSGARRHASLSRGLKPFVLYYGIHVGDVCVFQLIHRSPSPPLYKVTSLKSSSIMRRRGRS